MQILLIATDEHPKLQPLTDGMPTAMLPIVNRPVMSTMVEIAARSGYKNVLVSLCNRGGSIAAHFGSGSRWGIAIEYLTQREGWGTAGAIKWAADVIHETVLVVPADIVLDLDIDAALAFHRTHEGPATMIVQLANGQAPRHPVQLNDDKRVLSIVPTDEALAHTGAFILEPEVFATIPARCYSDAYSDLIPTLLATGTPVFGYVTADYWNPIDTFAAYQEAQQVFLHSDRAADDQADSRPRVRYPSIEGRQVAAGIWVGRNHFIHPNVRLAAPVCIGDNCWIGKDTELSDVVIGANVIVDDGATVHSSTVLDNIYLGQLINLDQRVVTATTLIDPATAEQTRVVDPFLLARATSMRGDNSWIGQWLSQGVASVLFVACLPVMIVLGVLVFVTAPGRVLVRSLRVQRRVVRDGGDWAELQTVAMLSYRTRNAGGYTLLGRWLEHSGLNYLPALWNVATGSLALVGVKPLLPEEAAQVNEDWQQQRFDRPAGITGLWYLQTTVDQPLDDVLVTDTYYAATRSWRNDIAIVASTPKIWMSRVFRRPAARTPNLSITDNDADYIEVK